jgi:hypothetical protein
MGKFDRYAFSAAPSFDEAATRQAFARAVPLRTLVIYCTSAAPRSRTPYEVVRRRGPSARSAIPRAIALLHHDRFPVIVPAGAPSARCAPSVAQHLFAFRNTSSTTPLRRYHLHRRRHHPRLGASTPTSPPLRPRRTRPRFYASLQRDTAHPRPRRHAQASRRRLRLLLRQRHRCPYRGGGVDEAKTLEPASSPIDRRQGLRDSPARRRSD